MKQNPARDLTTDRAFLRELECDDDSASRAHLAAGQPVVYRETGTPAGHVIQRHPDGRRELLRYEAGRATVVRELPPVEPFTARAPDRDH